MPAAAADQSALEFADYLLASGITAEQIMSFHTSEEADRRFDELALKRADNCLTEDEERELVSALHFEHIIRMVKARASGRLRLSQAS